MTIVKVGAKMVDVDLNHPFAGRELHFDVEIVGGEADAAEVRTATFTGQVDITTDHADEAGPAVKPFALAQKYKTDPVTDDRTRYVRDQIHLRYHLV